MNMDAYHFPSYAFGMFVAGALLNAVELMGEMHTGLWYLFGFSAFALLSLLLIYRDSKREVDE